ncbi:hypothetical protein ED733_008787 [Metarhizium rileyi]|uniref:C2H2-type domain-containing protein n=1 Tax=Metarhizium rileyi (strain RCEF 4871) TaxID=1649241 RepID=A0A5C6GQ12_METRR|nr:hypothetical protein ED733_008787 [Metarhizium rileyi]
MALWGHGCSVPPGGHNLQQEYVIQKFATDVANDPFIPTGIISDLSLARQQDQSLTDTQHRSPHFDSDDLHTVTICTNPDDSGYGGSRVSYTVTSPSVAAGREGSRSPLQCEVCDEFKAKNKSEFRKHMNRHTKPHKCGISSCPKGFATANDLDRHKKTVHRGECHYESNPTVYQCLHCLRDPGKQNRRKKQEWPRKDNFIAHLSRIHDIDSPVESLDQYIVQPLAEISPDSVQRSSNEAAQRPDLTGVGTFPDLIAPQTGGSYAEQLAIFASGRNQSNALTDHHPMRILQSNFFDHLRRNNVFDSHEASQCVSPNMLRYEPDKGLLDTASLGNAQNRALSLSFPPGMMEPLPQNDGMVVNLQYSGIAANNGETNEAGTDDNETDGLISDHWERTRPREAVAPECFEPPVPASHSDQSTDHCALMDIVKQLQLSPPVGTSPSLADHVRKLPQEVRDALVAALRASSQDDDDFGMNDIDAIAKGQTACHLCPKKFRRPYGMEQKSMDDWRYPDPEIRRDMPETTNNATTKGPTGTVQGYGPDVRGSCKRKAEMANLWPQPLEKKQNYGHDLAEMWYCDFTKLHNL